MRCSQTGNACQRGRSREILKKAGCWVVGEVCATLPSHRVALRTGVARVVISTARAIRMYMEGYKVLWTGSDCPNIIDHYTGEGREGVLQDMSLRQASGCAAEHGFSHG